MTVKDKFKNLRQLGDLKTEVQADVERVFTRKVNKRDHKPDEVLLELSTGEVGVVLKDREVKLDWLLGCLDELGVSTSQVAVCDSVKPSGMSVLEVVIQLWDNTSADDEETK